MKFWQDLRRRRVLRFAGLYIVGAWVVIQVADVFFPAWGIPDAALQYLFYAALACFPVALVFSWFYDVTGHGIVRTQPAGDAESVELKLRLKDYVVLAALIVVAGSIVFESVNRVMHEPAAEPQVVQETKKDKPPNSIAVLPFENLDPNPDTGYFSDGVSEEILHRLGSIRKLKVIARQSSFSMRGSDLGLDRISDLLGVRYLLGGSVRRSGDQVRLTAQLVDEDGFQVWSESFDGDLSDIFSFQADIAEQVASRVTREVIIVKSPEPVEPEAYSQYLIGKAITHDRPPGWKNRAAEAFRKAIEIDPEFAPPYAGLAIAIKFGADIDDSLDFWPYVYSLIDKALELDPELAEAYAGRGLPNFEEPDFDLRQNEENLRRALELDPTLGSAYNWLSIVLIESGQHAEAMDIRRQGIEIDPLNPPLVLNYFDYHLARNDPDAYFEAVSRLLELPTPPGMVYNALGGVSWDFGRLADSVKWGKQSIRVNKLSTPGLFEFALRYEALGMTEMANHWMNVASETDSPLAFYPRIELLRIRGSLEAADIDLPAMRALFGEDFPSLAGDIAPWLVTAGLYDEAIELLEPGFGELPAIEFPLRGLDLLHWLADAYQATGQAEQAQAVIAEAENRVSRFDLAAPFAGNPDLLIPLPRHYAAIEDYEQARYWLRKAIDAGWRQYYLEVHNPLWRGAWQRQDFAPLVEELRADIALQRAEVEAIERKHDFRAEYAAMIAEQASSE
jgi:TolB-like protein/tetratricopeptide (TPR) repeat protein